MRTQEPPARVRPGRASAGGRKAALLLGAAIGSVGLLVLGVVVGGPFVLAKRGDLPLERVYGDFAVSMASRIGGGNRQNPQANDRRALAAGREAYTGSCAVCHGATGDGRGVFGTSSYPNATDLRSHDAIEKSDAQMYWIIQNGLNFTGMPGFGDQYSDQDIWSLVTYIRALQDPARASQPATSQPGPSGGSGPSGGPGSTGASGGSGGQGAPGPSGGSGESVGAGSPGGTPAQGPARQPSDDGRGSAGPGPSGGPPFAGGQPGPRGGAQPFSLAPISIAAPTAEQLGRADPFSTEPDARGASMYFAQGCHLCHGAVGDAPGDLGLSRGAGPEATRAVRQGRPGMPAYPEAQVSDAELADLQAYLTIIGSSQQGGVDR
jgi:mono/diheme cytochrome c family protein